MSIGLLNKDKKQVTRTNLKLGTHLKSLIFLLSLGVAVSACKQPYDIVSVSTPADTKEKPKDPSGTIAVDPPAGDPPEIDVLVAGKAVESNVGVYKLPDYTMGVSPAEGTLVVTIKNSGKGDLKIDRISVPGVLDVSGIDLGAGVVLAGTSVDALIKLKNITVGAFTGKVIIENNDPDESEFAINFSAKVLPQPVPKIAVSVGGTDVTNNQAIPLALGSVYQGGAAATKIVKISNLGTANLNVGAINLSSGLELVGALPANPSVIAAGSSLSFSIRLSSAVLGDKVENLQILNNDVSNNPFNIKLSGTVSPAPAPEITVLSGNAVLVSGNGEAQNLGSVVMGAAATNLALTIRNDGTANLNLGAITLPAGYQVVGSAPSGAILPAASKTLTIRIDSSQAPQVFSGNLSIVNDDSDENPFIIALTGVVLPQPKPDIRVELSGVEILNNQSSAISFGPSKRGSAGDAKTFDVRNVGDANLSGISVSLPSGFSLVAAPKTSLAPGESTSFSVSLNTSVVANYSGNISIASNDPDENPFKFPVGGSSVEKDPMDDSQSFSVAVSSGKIDLLFVVDSSGSMSEEQATLQNSFAGFISGFVSQGLDYHIGVITTDVIHDYTSAASPGHWSSGINSRGKAIGSYPGIFNFGSGTLMTKLAVNRFVSSTQPQVDVISQFKANAAVGIVGSGREAGLASLTEALDPSKNGIGAPNAGFLRSDARLSMIVVSDEDESMDPYSTDAAAATNARYYIREDAAKKNDRIQNFVNMARSQKDPNRTDLVRFDAVVGTTDHTPTQTPKCPLNSEDGQFGTGNTYIEAVNLLGGKTIDICKGDFSSDLAQLGSDIAKGVERTFKLEHLPTAKSTIKVLIDGVAISEDVSNGWSYDSANNQVHLNGMALEAKTSFVVNIQYKYIP